MLFVKILIIAFFVLLAILIVLGIHALFEMKRDDEVIYRYNAKMDEVRKERIWQEKEKQRKIRGETKDAPQYAAGDEKDRINRQSYYEIPNTEAEKTDPVIVAAIIVMVVLGLIAFCEM